jgi:hypothetical protein
LCSDLWSLANITSIDRNNRLEVESVNQEFMPYRRHAAAMLARDTQQAPAILDLPVEIRRQILMYLFEDCELRIRWQQKLAMTTTTADDGEAETGVPSLTIVGLPQSLSLVCKSLRDDIESLKPFKIQRLNIDLCQDKVSEIVVGARSGRDIVANFSDAVSLKDVRTAYAHDNNLQPADVDVDALRAMFVRLESVEYRLKPLDLNVNAAPSWVWPVLLDEDNEVVGSSSDQTWASGSLIPEPFFQDQSRLPAAGAALKKADPSLQKNMCYFGRQDIVLWKESEAIIHLVRLQLSARRTLTDQLIRKFCTM